MPGTSRPSTRRRGSRGPRQPVALAERLRQLALLEAGLADSYAFRRASTNLRLQAFVWEVPVTVPAYDQTYTLQIELDERRSIRVTALGWKGPMRHTFGANSLCMWYPGDPPDRQWTRSDGLLKLVDTAVAHLFRELYFQETHEWLGEEVHRGAPKVEPRARLDQAA